MVKIIKSNKFMSHNGLVLRPIYGVSVRSLFAVLFKCTIDELWGHLQKSDLDLWITLSNYPSQNGKLLLYR